jgi:hypothetical protein
MSPDLEDIPPDWDSLKDRSTESEEKPVVLPEAIAEDHAPPVISLMAASWADLVGMLAVCTAALIAVLALGEPPALSVFPWAAALALAWWAFAASVLVLVRQGTPGMLLAGVVFEEPVPAPRVPGVLAAAVFGVATFGLVGLLGPRSSLLRLAAATELATVGEE